MARTHFKLLVVLLALLAVVQGQNSTDSNSTTTTAAPATATATVSYSIDSYGDIQTMQHIINAGNAIPLGIFTSLSEWTKIMKNAVDNGWFFGR